MIISSEIKCDQVWSSLDKSDSIWSKKIEDWKSDDKYISMIISSEIENVEKVKKLDKVTRKKWEKHFKSFR